MASGLFILLKIIGSMVLFLFGMQLMSESLQKVAGDRLRHTLYAMTSTRFRGVLTGFIITGFVQSSSATSVMLVSLVNAGMISLVDSVGVIMGANIGTTLTAWIISLVGLRVQIGELVLPLIAISFPLIFTKKSRKSNWGRVILGFAILFIGLDFLKNTIPDFESNPEIFKFLENYTGWGWFSVLLFVLLGVVLTAIFQSSSAIMALTLVVSAYGWITFEHAMAMVLGLNLGTTITANLAAIIANRLAKRAALIHSLFNLIGILMILPFFGLIAKGLGGLIEFAGFDTPETDSGSIPFALSLFHTLFNLFTAIVLIGFVRLLVSISFKIIPISERGEGFRFNYLATGMVATPELSIYQSKAEILGFARQVKKMFMTMRMQLVEVNEQNFTKRALEVDDLEERCDKSEREINRYLTQLSERDVSQEGSRRIIAYLEIIDSLESAADCVFNINRTFKRKNKQRIWFSPDLREKVSLMFDRVEGAFEVTIQNLEVHSSLVDMDTARKREEEVNELRNELKQEHLSKLENPVDYKITAGFLYNDIFSELEKLADYLFNVSQAVERINAQERT